MTWNKKVDVAAAQVTANKKKQGDEFLNLARALVDQPKSVSKETIAAILERTGRTAGALKAACGRYEQRKKLRAVFDKRDETMQLRGAVELKISEAKKRWLAFQEEHGRTMQALHRELGDAAAAFANCDGAGEMLRAKCPAHITARFSEIGIELRPLREELVAITSTTSRLAQDIESLKARSAFLKTAAKNSRNDAEQTREARESDFEVRRLEGILEHHEPRLKELREQIKALENEDAQLQLEMLDP